MAEGDPRKRSGASGRVTPRSTASRAPRRIRARDVVIVVLLMAGLISGLFMVLFSGGTTDPPPEDGASEDRGLPFDDVSMAGVEDWSGLDFPAGAQDFLTARVGDDQLDLTFTMAAAEAAEFITASGLPEPEPGVRRVLHSSPLWKLNPGADDEGTGTAPGASEPDPSQPDAPEPGSDAPEPGSDAPAPGASEVAEPDPEIRGASDRRGSITRSVELVDEAPDEVRARIVLRSA